ncbi:polyprenyl synthetase family protein [Actinoplanes utahensis]|uniref:Polyprenyl synthetase n=1 Tax=Actinoplanes utahensis TaxID=1869 RepID=A0A0A6UQK3_ACTUT|nr:polyprenyl synthetase family protein [Actinoplanes utahensis]KHD77716.1 polyprenyl synthetase [Actinoplanes utahensis]GIF31382.1 geranylgeranyl pyrophosphate synthase [Actinoplanes utahensis]
MTISPLDRAGLRPRVDKALSGFLATQRARLLEIDPALAEVADTVSAFVLGGGKRLRPAFAYWGFRAAGGVDSSEVVAAVAALELVQASALIHDDLMDRSDTRRGEPSVHRRFEVLHVDEGWRGGAAGFGDSAAVLLGDLAMVWSDEMLHSSGMGLAELARARPVFDQMRTEVTVGQYLDVLTQATGEMSRERAGKVARFKSAKYTVERPLLLGAALAGAGPEVFASYAAFGLPLGEAFQMRDDVLGVFGDPAQTGKPAGDDLREGKRTYLVAAAFEALGAAGRAELDRALGDPGLDDAGVERLRAVIRESGALAATEARIDALSGEALAALKAAPVEDEGREALLALADAAVRRSV